MIKIQILVAFLITGSCLPGSLTAQTRGYHNAVVMDGSSDDIQGIKSALAGIYKALADSDVKAYSSYTAPGYHVLEQGEYWDLDYAISKIGNKKPAGYSRKDTIDYKLIEVCNDMAFVIWDLYATVDRGGTLSHYQWLESGTLKKINGDWKVHMLHSTRVEDN